MVAQPKQSWRWSFWSAALAVLALIALGQVVGAQLGRWPPVRALLARMGADYSAQPWQGGILGAMTARDWVFGAFLVTSTGFFWVQRASLTRFFRSMHVGVTLVSLTLLAILTGVLVPQIDNFEDPEQRVTPANYQEELRRFSWAEGYFAYHLIHLYGVGMPTAQVPPGATEGLERFGRIYGEEEQKNRAKMMEAAFSGQAISQDIEDFIAAHQPALRRLFDAATWLDLNRAYKSNWFASLLFLLGISVALNSVKFGWRKTLTIHKAGFFVTHMGILILLCGGFVSKLWTDRGILQLFLGDAPRDTYYRHYQNDKLARMPFAVRLDHFARKEWKAIEVHFLDQPEFTSRLPRYTVWPGREVDLDWVQVDGEWQSRLKLRVKELSDHARVGLPKVSEGDEHDGLGTLPVAELEIPNTPASHAGMDGDADAEEGPTRRLFLSPQLVNQVYADPAGRFRVATTFESDPRSLFPAEDDGSLGTLDVEVLGSGESTPIPTRVRLGERVKLPRGYELEFKQATRDFRRGRDSLTACGDTRPLASQPDGFRALWVDIFPPDGKPPERRLVLEMLDAVEYGLQQDYANKDVVARLRWDRWTEPSGPRFVLAWDRAGKATLTSEAGTVKDVHVGEPLPLGLEGGAAVKPLHFYARARFEKNIQFVERPARADGWDESFYSQDPRGIVLEVVRFPGTPKESVEAVRMATSNTGRANVWKSDDERLGIVFLENTEGFPFDWRSVLSIVERDAEGKPFVVDCGTEKEREIRVNDYFKYRGYRFFQTNADPAQPTYSGIGVVYDPGIEIVLTGMYTIIAGTVIAFLVRPIWLSRTSSRLKGA
jgi:hypothetical protein